MISSDRRRRALATSSGFAASVAMRVQCVGALPGVVGIVGGGDFLPLSVCSFDYSSKLFGLFVGFVPSRLLCHVRSHLAGRRWGIYLLFIACTQFSCVPRAFIVVKL